MTHRFMAGLSSLATGEMNSLVLLKSLVISYRSIHGIMSKIVCPVCLRAEGDLQPGDGKSESREVSLASVQSAAASGCSICSFVNDLINEDESVRKMDEREYDTTMVRVEDDGLRFTGQWQGALVIEIFKSSRYSDLHIRI